MKKIILLISLVVLSLLLMIVSFSGIINSRIIQVTSISLAILFNIGTAIFAYYNKLYLYAVVLSICALVTCSVLSYNIVSLLK